MFSEVFSELSRITLTPTEVAASRDMLEEMRKGVAAAAETVRASHAASLAGIEIRRARLLDLFLSGTLEKPEFEEKRRELDGARAEAMLAAASAEASETEKYDLTSTFIEKLRDATSEFMKATNDERRALLRDIGFDLIAKARKVHVHAHEPAALVMSRGDLPTWWGLLERVAMSFGAKHTAERAAGQATEQGGKL